jgi:hypothetical protein
MGRRYHTLVRAPSPAHNRAAMNLRMLSAVAGLVAAASLVAGTFTMSWWEAPYGNTDAHIGMRALRVCVQGECTTLALSRLGELGWVRAGVAASVAGGLAAALLLFAAAALAIGRVPRLLARTTLVAAVVALVTGLGFALGFPHEGARAGYSMALFLAGAVVAVAVAVAALRAARATASA